MDESSQNGKPVEVVVDPLVAIFGDRLDVYHALNDVDDLRFRELTMEGQKSLIDTLILEEFPPGSMVETKEKKNQLHFKLNISWQLKKQQMKQKLKLSGSKRMVVKSSLLHCGEGITLGRKCLSRT